MPVLLFRRILSAGHTALLLSASRTFSMAKKVPDRWLDYTPIGKVIEGSSFVAFKVPLHENICQRLPSPERHTTKDITASIPRLGLVINLTNTKTDTKYYQPKDWQRHGIEYKWIKTEGHVTPSQSLLIEFCRTVKNFLASNPDKLVGCHCTHGLNRTGYFVCSFMVLCNNLSPTEAMKNFADARGHPIERPNYIDSIESHSSNETLKKRLAYFKPAVRNDGGASRKFSTHTSSSRNVPRRNEAGNRPNWRSDRHDYSRDRSIPDDNRFYSNPRDNSQIGRGGPRSIRGGYRDANNHNHDPHPLPRNSSSRSNSRESNRGAGRPGPSWRGRGGNQWSSNASRRGYNLRNQAETQCYSNSHPDADMGWNNWVAGRMRR